MAKIFSQHVPGQAKALCCDLLYARPILVYKTEKSQSVNCILRYIKRPEIDLQIT